MGTTQQIIEIDLDAWGASDRVIAAMLHPLDPVARLGIPVSRAAAILGLLEAGEADRAASAMLLPARDSGRGADLARMFSRRRRLEALAHDVAGLAEEAGAAGASAFARTAAAQANRLAAAVRAFRLSATLREAAETQAPAARAQFSFAAVGRGVPGTDAVQREIREQFGGAPCLGAFVVARMVRAGPRASQNKARAEVEAETGKPSSTFRLDKLSPVDRAKLPLWAAAALAVELSTGRKCAPADFGARLGELVATHSGRTRVFALEPAVRQYCEKHMAPGAHHTILREDEAVEYRTGVAPEPLPQPDDFRDGGATAPYTRRSSKGA